MPACQSYKSPTFSSPLTEAGSFIIGMSVSTSPSHNDMLQYTCGDDQSPKYTMPPDNCDIASLVQGNPNWEVECLKDLET